METDKNDMNNEPSSQRELPQTSPSRSWCCEGLHIATTSIAIWGYCCELRLRKCVPLTTAYYCCNLCRLHVAGLLFFMRFVSRTKRCNYSIPITSTWSR